MPPADKPAATIYRYSHAGMDGLPKDFATYDEAASIFRAHVQQNVAWCEVWEITGMSAMGPLCAYKRVR